MNAPVLRDGLESASERTIVDNDAPRPGQGGLTVHQLPA